MITSQSIINKQKNIAIIASLSKIYCASDLKKKRTLTVYKNITQYNNQPNNRAMRASPNIIKTGGELRCSGRERSFCSTWVM